ncbi:MAG: pyridoxal-phosphate dependent enzyme [Candidatus Sulfomarinibacteraceae bacterium]
MREVLEARRRIEGRIRLTECRRSAALSAAAGADVRLKLENTQVSGSFKLRGVMNKLLSLSPEDRGRLMVAASTGNHGAAFAHGVAELGLEGLLFLPTNASAKKLEAIEASGIPFELVGDDCVETERHARDFAAKNGAVWVSPYNDPAIVAGQGTIGPELVEQVAELGSVLIPVGGGGLAGGIAGFFKTAAPAVEIVGCEPEASAVMAESVAAGGIVEMESLPTLSDATTGGIEEGSITFDLCRRFVDRWVRVSEDEIAAAIRFMVEREGMVVEGGAALPVAVALGRPEFLLGRTVALVVTGSKIDDAVLAEVLGR